MLNIVSVVWDFIKQVFGVVSGEQTAKYVAEGEEVTAVAQMQSAVSVRWWFVAAVPPLFALPFIIYTWKVIVYDKVLAFFTNGSTDPLSSTMGNVFMIIVGFYFFHSWFTK